MGYPGMGGLDTPRTNVGDATYLNRPPDFDISQEASFTTPQKDDDIFQQMRNGGKPNLRTPRGGGNGGGNGRAPFSNRLNLPSGIGGVEFTPLLKSATRNSARRASGKENGGASTGPVPFALGRIDEDNTTTPIPGAMDMSSYGVSRNASYVESTPLPGIDSSSLVSTPLALQARKKDDGKGPLPLDGNQLSLREQENVIDKIEKENFGLKLKIHFLEEALHKAGPGYSEAALKENTELKVDKVTLQRELHRYKKLVTSAEHNLENYRAEMQEMQAKMARRQVDESLRSDMEQLQKELAAKDAALAQVQQQGEAERAKLRDTIEDLEADVRDKDRQISQKEDELEDLQLSMDARLDEHQQQLHELEAKAGTGEKLDEAKETIEELEADVRRLEGQVDDLNEKLEDAARERQRAEDDLEELQEEMANKSVHTKGLSRQTEEKMARLQGEAERAQQETAQATERQEELAQEVDDLKQKLKESRQARDEAERTAQSAATQLKTAQADLQMARDQKGLLQTRHDALTGESAALQRDVTRLQKTVAQLEADVAAAQQDGAVAASAAAGNAERDVQTLQRQVNDLRTEIREKERLYDIDSAKWEADHEQLEDLQDRLEVQADETARRQQQLESEADRHAAEEALLRRQLESAQRQLETRQDTLEGLRRELAGVREELRAAEVRSETAAAKAESLQDEVDALRRTLDGRVGGRDREPAADEKQREQQREEMRKLRTQMAEATATASRATQEKKRLEEELADVQAEMHVLEEHLRQEQQVGGEKTTQLDHERLDLRTAKTRLDGEVRRLREENRSLADQCETLERTLEEELDKAATEEERLGQELQAARRTMRELETAVSTAKAAAAAATAAAATAAAETKLPTVDESELEELRKDLAEARANERNYLQREATQRETVKALRRQIADLERAAHEAEISRLMGHDEDDENDAEAVAQLGEQLTTALQAANELRRRLRDTEQQAAAAAASAAAEAAAAEVEREAQIRELEEERAVLEQALDEAQETQTATAELVAKTQATIERLRRERDELAEALIESQEKTVSESSAGSSEMSREERANLHAMLRKTQVEADALEHELRDHRTALAGAAQAEESLRVKLERARNERAAHRNEAERLRTEVEGLRAALHYGDVSRELVLSGHGGDTKTLVRAAEQQSIRHRKELRGLGMQIEWMQARWEREALLRNSAVLGKQLVAADLEMRIACNNADLHMLRDILRQLGVAEPPALLSSSPKQQLVRAATPHRLRRVVAVVRFVIRLRLSAAAWARQETMRQRLAAAAEGVRKAERMQQMRAEWREQLAAATAQ